MDGIVFREEKESNGARGNRFQGVFRDTMPDRTCPHRNNYRIVMDGVGLPAMPHNHR